MKHSKNISYLVVGLALFSMFFGGGNLIFPLFVGQLAQDQWIFATCGFILTAVLVPFLGAITMVIYKGNYTRFFSCLGNRGGFLLAFLLLGVWIPLGSAPRCITLAFSSLAKHFTMPALWLFSIGYCLLVGWISTKRSRMLDILGYILTPALLLCIAVIVFMGLKNASGLELSSFSGSEMLVRGMKEGYNTMDLIASFFFTSSIISILKKEDENENKILKTMLHSSVIGVLLLGIVYVGLILTAAQHAPHLAGVPKVQLLVHVANTSLGADWGVVAALAVTLACFTTSVALASVYIDFLKEQVFKGRQWVSLAVTLVVTFVMSIFGLEGISFVTEPVLQIFYPLLFILIVWNVGKELLFKQVKQEVV